MGILNESTYNADDVETLAAFVIDTLRDTVSVMGLYPDEDEENNTLFDNEIEALEIACKITGDDPAEIYPKYREEQENDSE